MFFKRKPYYDYVKPDGSWFVIGKEKNFMSVQTFTNNFQLLVDEYGLTDHYGARITPHGLRHNLATVGINSHMDIASLSVMMGHASRSMTLDTYGDASPNALKLATEQLALQFEDESDLALSDDTAEKIYALQKKHRQVTETEKDKARAKEIEKNRYSNKQKTE